MILFEACPRCSGGDLVIEHVDEEYRFACLQCGESGVLRSVYPLTTREPRAKARSIRGRPRASPDLTRAAGGR